MDQIFGGGVRNPPTTVEGIVAEAANIEKALLARAGYYHRSVNVQAQTRSSLDCEVCNLREIVRDVVRAQLKKLLPVPDHLFTVSVAELVREHEQALQP